MTPLDTLCDVPFYDLSDHARARVLNRLADTELFVVLEKEPAEDRVRLELLDLPVGRMAIAADREDRLTDFLGAPVVYVSLPGRILIRMLVDETVTLLVNPGTPSEMVLDPPTLDWLIQALAQAPKEDRVDRAHFSAPLPEMLAALAEPLALRLADMSGLIKKAGLVLARWPDGDQGHLIVIVDAPKEQQPAIAKTLAEMFAFLPVLPGSCDVAFDIPLPEDALIFELDQSAPEPGHKLGPPGRDPDKPPILRF